MVNAPYLLTDSVSMPRRSFVLACIAAICCMSGVLAAPSLALAQAGGGYRADEWAKVLAAAKAEGKVLVYANSPPALLDRLRADFNAANPGIALEFGRYPGNGVIVRIDQEREAKAADGADAGITSEIPWAEERAKAGLLKGPSGPSTVAWPAKYLLGGVVPVLAIEPFLLAYNTKLVTTPITGYQDLLRPELKGKVNTTEPVSAVVVSWYDWLGKTQGGDFMAKFAANNPLILGGGTVQNMQSVAAGETSATAFTIMTVITPLIAQGAPVKAVMPSPALGTRALGVIPVGARRPNAALVFMDYMTSARGQTVWAGKGEAASALPNIPGAMDAGNISFINLSEYTPDVIKAYIAKWKQQFPGK